LTGHNGCCSNSNLFPPTSLPSDRGIFEGRVVENASICREHYRLTVSVLAFPEAKPGQFVHIRCSESSERGWTGGAFIRRPFSIGGLRRTAVQVGEQGREQVELDILYRAIGTGTQWLARVKPGETINLLGPQGQPFRLPEVNNERPTTRGSSVPSKPLALLVGGGIGLPPLIWLAESLHAAGIPAVAFCGSRSADLLPLKVSSAANSSGGLATSSPTASLCCEELARFGVPAVIATDDGSLGVKGLLPDVLDAWLEQHADQARSVVVYTCGPDRMMKAVTDVCFRRQLACQVCLERMMACGMGTCQSCVVRIRDTSAAEGWRYRLCCTDGPVFDAQDVLWA